MKKIVSFVLLTVLWVAVLSLTVLAHSQSSGTNLIWSNNSAQNYSTYASPICSYLAKSDNGNMMTVTYDTNYDAGSIEVSYYTSQRKLIKTVVLSQELPIFGGFYETENGFYILTGQENPDEKADVEVYRVTKYDKDWKRIGSVGLYDCNTTIPFRAGSARFTHNGKTLVIRTCHQMYTSDDGLRHQANLTFSVNTETMSIIDSFYRVANIRWGGYVSHSFNQFIQYVDGQLVAIDHGDAYPRAVSLVVYYPSAFATPSSGCNVQTVAHLVNIPGQIGDNYTGVSVGGFEASSTTYIVVGNSELDSAGARNVFVSALSRDGSAINNYYLTKDTSKSASTPHLVKISNDKFMVLWTVGDTVYYVLLNNKGEKSGDIHRMKGSLSDCAPVVIDNKVQWYTYKQNDVTFYAINVSSLKSTSSVTVNNGHQYVQKNNSKYHWNECTVCKKVTDKESHVNTAQTTKMKFNDSGNLDVTCKECGWVFTSEPISITVQKTNSSQLTESYKPILKRKSGTVLVNDQDYDYYWSRWSYGSSLYRFTLHFWGEDPYSGNFEKTFYSLADYASVADVKTQTYTGKAIKPTVRVLSDDGTTLKAGVDYTVTYKNNVKVGTATVTVTGKGEYFGTITKTFKICKSIKNAKVTGITDKTFSGKSITQSVKVSIGGKTLKSGTDFTVAYKNNVKAGTATVTVKGKGNYIGSVSKTFRIKPISSSKCTFKLSATGYTYNGKVRTPSVVVKNAAGKTLKKNTDYTVTYASGRKNAGTYKVTVKMKGNYTGTKTLSFKINPISISKCTVKLSTTAYTYNGKAKTPSVTVKNANGTKLVRNQHYTVTYASGRKNVGTYKVTVKMKGNYSGTKTLTFKILPTKTTVSKLASAKSTVKVTISRKKTQVTGYQVRYSASKKFTGSKIKTITNYKTGNVTLSGLKSKTTYYVRVRTYKTVNGKKYYSAWSDSKSVKTK